MRILITGGSRGLGKALTHYLQNEGHTVFAPKRDILDLAAIGTVYSYCDECLGDIDVLINNAAVYLNKPIIDTYWHDLYKTLEVNFIGHVELTRALMLSEKLKEDAHIFNISTNDLAQSKTNQLAYNCSKAALEEFTRCLQKEYPNLTVNTLRLPVLMTTMYDPDIDQVDPVAVDIAANWIIDYLNTTRKGEVISYAN